MMQSVLTQILDLEDIHCPIAADQELVSSMVLLIAQCGCCPIPLVVIQRAFSVWQLAETPLMAALYEALRRLVAENLHEPHITVYEAKDDEHAAFLTVLHADS